MDIDRRRVEGKRAPHVCERCGGMFYGVGTKKRRFCGYSCFAAARKACGSRSVPTVKEKPAQGASVSQDREAGRVCWGKYNPEGKRMEEAIELVAVLALGAVVYVGLCGIVG